jgi:hypothetical protein
MLVVYEGYLGCGGVPESKLCAARTRPVPNFDAKTWGSGEGKTDNSRSTIFGIKYQTLYIDMTCVARLYYARPQLCAIPKLELEGKARDCVSLKLL